ncbi:Ribosomal biogenesis protein las1l [Phytophthora boehmeriae]|uniref:Ribosomal biogenesis protein las1l n=1 Tax=Phytophthora boehmeriae TaxID=109152 RepID=A0A8T1WTX5_9STRA|nr:Ribosomal biogenesis protein las1l [Phytophthora boehmeriae]
MSGRKSAVPWLSWTEWQQVHQGLFSSDPYVQQRFVSRVASWRSRVQLPVAINATAQLVELQLHEQISQHHHHAVGVSSRSHMELSLLYASVVVRCVNGLVDGSQKGAYATAVSLLAQRIGIPLWVVDLRHESTHNQLPSLPVLRFAAQHLLAWLRANYWGAQEDAIRGQVHHVAQWLFAQLSHLNQAVDGEIQGDGSVQNGVGADPRVLQPVLDADNLRNIVVPLLVGGEQYGERMAPTGLLFLDAPLLPEGVEIFQKETFCALFLQLQAQWRGFSASLLARLCRRVFDIVCPPKKRRQSDGDDDQPDVSLDIGWQTSEMELVLLWIKYLVNSEWREKLKFEAGPIEDLYQCGAEMLALAEQQSSNVVAEDLLNLLERLQTALRSIKGIRQHPQLGYETAIASSVAGSSEQGWVELPAWMPSPIGLRHCYSNYDSSNTCQIREFSLDDDSLVPDSSTFVVPEEEEDEGSNTTVDPEEAMDAVMEDLDSVYDSALQQTLDLKATIARDGLRQGGSSTVLPKQELERIQDEIEIW